MKAGIALLLAFVLAGCAAGRLYTHTTEPLTLDMKRTPVSETQTAGNIKHLVVSSDALSWAWDSNAIGDLAKKKGLSEVFFADLEILSILGFWNQYTVHVYGR